MNLKQIYKLFPTETDCINHLVRARWYNKPCCPYCGSENPSSTSGERRYHCNTCNTSFSVTVRTVFHRTHIPLQKWFLAMSKLLGTDQKISSRQLAEDLGVNKDTAWRMAIRIDSAILDREQRDFFYRIIDNK
jgi:transposase-like protein